MLTPPKHSGMEINLQKEAAICRPWYTLLCILFDGSDWRERDVEQLPRSWWTARMVYFSWLLL